MDTFRAAQERFRNVRTNETAILYHRAAWRAYLHSDLSNDAVFYVMAELHEFWDEAVL